jgi:hypothetical protein
MVRTLIDGLLSREGRDVVVAAAAAEDEDALVAQRGQRPADRQVGGAEIVTK